MLRLENHSTDDLEKLRSVYQEVAEEARRSKGGGSSDTGTPDVAACV